MVRKHGPFVEIDVSEELLGRGTFADIFLGMEGRIVTMVSSACNVGHLVPVGLAVKRQLQSSVWVPAESIRGGGFDV